MNFQDDFEVKISQVTLNESEISSPIIKNHSCVYYNNSLIFFGGYNSYENTNELYIYSFLTNQFTQIQQKGDIPKPRNGHTATIIPSEKRMIMIGGWLGEQGLASDEIYSLDLETFTWTSIHSKPSISSTNMHTADLYNNKIYIFRGGNGISFLSDLTSLDIDTYEVEKIKLDGKNPPPRANHMSSIIKDYLFIFGGWSGTNLLNDLYCINLHTRLSQEVAYEKDIYPSVRAGSRMVSSNNSYLILFGGFQGKKSYLNDLYIYNYETRKWICSTPQSNNGNVIPSPRAGHSMTIINDRYIYIYGGSNKEYCRKLYEIDIDVEPSIKSVSKKSLLSEESIFTQDEYFNYVRKMYNNKNFSDIKIIVENKSIFAHKIILSFLSEKFRNMFEYEKKMNKGKNKILIIKGYKYIHFEIFIKFLYLSVENLFLLTSENEDLLSIINQKDEFDIFSIKSETISENCQPINSIQGWGLNDFFELLRISDEYMVNTLKSLCEKKITTFLTTSNYSLIEAFSKKFYCQYLMKYLKWYFEENKLNIILENFTIVVSSEDNSITIDKSVIS